MNSESMSPLNIAAGSLANGIEHLGPAARQAAFLVLIDVLANVCDYAYHIYLGRSLSPPDFAIIQTLSALLLIILTAAGAWQPVVARFVAADGTSGAGPVASVVQHYFMLALGSGALLVALSWLARAALSSWLNVPAPTIIVAAPILIAALARPVAGGALQGQERFVAFGLTRIVYSAGRLLLALVFIGALGGGLLAAVATLPFGATLSLAIGLLLIGPDIWRRATPLTPASRVLGWRLTAGALVAYTAYMGLVNLDLIWVNRALGSDVAASYAAGVLLRRVLALLPAAVTVVIYPRVVTMVARGKSLNAMLLKAFLAVGMPSLALTVIYFALPEFVVTLTFGASYLPAAPLLGWLGLAMTAYALAGLWMNVYLATRPAPFTVLLLLTALVQMALYAALGASLRQIIVIFSVCGWFLACAGTILYLLWLRPALADQNLAHSAER